jgi:transposase
LWNRIKNLGVQPVFSTTTIARHYGHQLKFTPPYYPELQPIEKVWGIVKNPIAFNPCLNETTKSLQQRLENALDSVTEEQLLGCWKACVKQAQQYQKDYMEKATIQPASEGSSRV